MTRISILFVATFLICPASSPSPSAIGRLILSTVESPEQPAGAKGEGFSLGEQNTTLAVITTRTTRGILFADDDGDDDDGDDDDGDDDNANGLSPSMSLVERIADGPPALFPSAVAKASFL